MVDRALGVSAKCNEVELLISCSEEVGEKSESISKVAAVARKNLSQPTQNRSHL